MTPIDLTVIIFAAVVIGALFWEIVAFNAGWRE